jgi:hypothetical protein
MLQCGLPRSNFSFPISSYPQLMVDLNENTDNS